VASGFEPATHTLTEDGLAGRFNRYCVPLYRHPTREQFCAAKDPPGIYGASGLDGAPVADAAAPAAEADEPSYKWSDACVWPLDNCDKCTGVGAFWCPSSKQCLREDWDGFNHCYADKCAHDVVTTTTTTTAAPLYGTATTTPPPIKKFAHYYWELNDARRWRQGGYIPDPVQAVKQGEPEIFGKNGLEDF